MAVAALIAGAVAVSGCGTASDAASSDPALLVIDRLFEAFNAEDAEEVAGVFGDDVAFIEDDKELVGVDAATFWQGYIGRETVERITDAFHAPDGRTYLMADFTTSQGAKTTYVFDVEMDGERLVGMTVRTKGLGELVATTEIDNLYEAFNDQDLDRLSEEFEGMSYTSPSGVNFKGAEAAAHWADSFGATITRTTAVFAIGDGVEGGSNVPLVFVTEHTKPDGISTAYAVEVELLRGQIASMTEREPQTWPALGSETND